MDRYLKAVPFYHQYYSRVAPKAHYTPVRSVAQFANQVFSDRSSDLPVEPDDLRSTMPRTVCRTVETITVITLQLPYHPRITGNYRRKLFI